MCGHNVNVRWHRTFRRFWCLECCHFFIYSIENNNQRYILFRTVSLLSIIRKWDFLFSSFYTSNFVFQTLGIILFCRIQKISAHSLNKDWLFKFGINVHIQNFTETLLELLLLNLYESFPFSVWHHLFKLFI